MSCEGAQEGRGVVGWRWPRHHRRTLRLAAVAALAGMSGVGHLTSGLAAGPAQAPRSHELVVRQRLAPTPGRLEEYAAERRKSVVELQPSRDESRMAIGDPVDTPGAVTLTNLNPRINTWFLLRLEGSGGESYHLELANPDARRLILDSEYPSGVVIEEGETRDTCTLWRGHPSALAQARASRLSYAPLCDGRLYLRNQLEGHKTIREWMTDFLRDRVWKGERITGFVRETFFRDAWRATSALSGDQAALRDAPLDGPPPLLLLPGTAERLLVPVGLGLSLEGEEGGRIAVGRWYEALDNPGIFAAALRADLVAPEVIESLKGAIEPLDPTEAEALVYLVAFDLDRFDLGFSLGTDHPRVGWSDMVQEPMRSDTLPGPDGIGSLEPLARTGLLNPIDATRVAATFTGGFKRAHGAFQWSQFAKANRGSHYGFIENGVILSKLQPGLATVVVFDDGTVDLKTWTAQDATELPWIRHARQNGVAILEYQRDSDTTTAGALLRQWGPGNWSGSPGKKLRTLRAGLCLQEARGRRFLTYGYFSTATPSAMAAVFQASGCRYAMLLDMNALEHTYLAVYRTQDSRLLTQHLIDEMSVVDRYKGDQYLPRFVGFADNRDFFYLLRRDPS